MLSPASRKKMRVGQHSLLAPAASGGFVCSVLVSHLPVLFLFLFFLAAPRSL